MPCSVLVSDSCDARSPILVLLEVLARLRGLIRRAHSQPRPVTCGEVTLDPRVGRVTAAFGVSRTDA